MIVIKFLANRSAMVELEKGPVLVGGQTQDVNFLDTLYQLTPKTNGDLEWQLMSKKLATARSYHVAFLVDDGDCDNDDDDSGNLEATEGPASAEDADDDSTTPSESE